MIFYFIGTSAWFRCQVYVLLSLIVIFNVLGLTEHVNDFVLGWLLTLAAQDGLASIFREKHR